MLAFDLKEPVEWIGSSARRGGRPTRHGRPRRPRLERHRGTGSSARRSRSVADTGAVPPHAASDASGGTSSRGPRPS